MKNMKCVIKYIGLTNAGYKKLRASLTITLLHWILQTLVQELGSVEPRTMGWEPAINFETDIATLDPQAKRLLDIDIAVLKQYRELRVNVRGYADKVGTVASNLQLSKRRADSAVNYLVAGGISRSRIEKVSLGEDGPVVNTKDEEELATNRRVELVLLDFNGNLVRYKVANSTSQESTHKVAHGES